MNFYQDDPTHEEVAAVIALGKFNGDELFCPYKWHTAAAAAWRALRPEERVALNAHSNPQTPKKGPR